MKSKSILSLALIVALCLAPLAGQATNKIYYSKTALTGGAETALDYIDGDLLTDGDVAHVMTGGLLYTYKLNATSGATESSPSIISPDTNAGDKRWVLQREFTDLPNLLFNVGLTATVSSKALTVTLTGANGNASAAGNASLIGFRSATLTDGKPVVRSVTSSLSIVLTSGSTLGFTAAEVGRLYVWAIDNAGTVELALSRTADIFPESGLVSTTAEGGAGGADSATVMYSNTARNNVACRCLGYIEIETGATEGEWDNAASKIQVMGPGIHRTGDIVQSYCVVKSDTFSASATSWDAITGLAKTLTPTSAINKIRLKTAVNVGANAAAYVGIRFTRDGSAIGVPAAAGNRQVGSASSAVAGAGGMQNMSAIYEDSPASVSALAYAVQLYCNGVIPHVNRTGTDSDAADYHRTISTLIVEEVFQ